MPSEPLVEDPAEPEGLVPPPEAKPEPIINLADIIIGTKCHLQ